MSPLDVINALPCVRRAAPLSGCTTLGVGGPADLLASPRDRAETLTLLRAAAAAELPVFPLGEGSNVLAADAGYRGLVLRLPGGEVEAQADPSGGALRLRAPAGARWEAVVEAAVSRGAGGVECLSGIPGTAGAAPIQNIGAYGQEVGEVLVAVTAYDRAADRVIRLEREACALGYRDSRFKRAPEAFVVLEVELALPLCAAPCLRYPEVSRALAAAGRPVDLASVRATVRALRREKGMLLPGPGAEGSAEQNAPGPPSDLASAGSFFLNPVVEPGIAEMVRSRARAAGCPEPPAHAQADGRLKLSAAWLITQAGIERGLRRGRAGVSTRHSLALTNLGGASAAEVLALAAHVRDAVHRRFGVTLTPEPVLLGFDAPADRIFADRTPTDEF